MFIITQVVIKCDIFGDVSVNMQVPKFIQQKNKKRNSVTMPYNNIL